LTFSDIEISDRKFLSVKNHIQKKTKFFHGGRGGARGFFFTVWTWMHCSENDDPIGMIREAFFSFFPPFFALFVELSNDNALKESMGLRALEQRARLRVGDGILFPGLAQMEICGCSAAMELPRHPAR
jgi:hypothetical protein